MAATPSLWAPSFLLFGLLSSSVAGTGVESLPEALAADDACHASQGAADACGTALLQTKSADASSVSPRRAKTFCELLPVMCGTRKSQISRRPLHQISESSPMDTQRAQKASDTASMLLDRPDTSGNHISKSASNLLEHRVDHTVNSRGNSSATRDDDDCYFMRHRNACYIHGVVCATSCGATHPVLNRVCNEFNHEDSVRANCDSAFTCDTEFSELLELGQTVGAEINSLVREYGGDALSVAGVKFYARSLPLIGCSMSSLASMMT